MPSDSMAELPVINAAMNFVAAMSRFDAMAPYTAMGLRFETFAFPGFPGYSRTTSNQPCT
jgi:hypothetical protein